MIDALKKISASADKQVTLLATVAGGVKISKTEMDAYKNHNDPKRPKV